MRTTLAIAAALAMAISMGLGAPAEAAKAKSKQCMTTNAAGKKITFKCGAEERCCWQIITQKAACVAPPGICL